MEGVRNAMKGRNLNEGQWEDRKQWSLGVGQRIKTFWNRYMYLYKLHARIASCRTKFIFFCSCPL
jgi:hypothetical protein